MKAVNLRAPCVPHSPRDCSMPPVSNVLDYVTYPLQLSRCVILFFLVRFGLLDKKKQPQFSWQDFKWGGKGQKLTALKNSDCTQEFTFCLHYSRRSGFFIPFWGVAFYSLSKFLVLCFQCHVNTAAEVISTLFTLGAISVIFFFVRFATCIVIASRNKLQVEVNLLIHLLVSQLVSYQFLCSVPSFLIAAWSEVEESVYPSLLSCVLSTVFSCVARASLKAFLNLIG